MAIAGHHHSASVHRLIGSSHHREAGFSLIELAIFLTVLALIMAAALSWLAPSARDEAVKVLQTRERIHGIQEAIRTFRVNYERLPCPAAAQVSDRDPETLAGLEDCSGFKTTGQNLGIVPYRTLGLSAEYRVDGWGRRFSYHVSRKLCDLEQTGTVANCSKDTYALADGVGTDLTVRTVRPNAPNPDDPTKAENYVDIPAVAYVIVSHGVNGDGAWMPSGQQRISGRAQSTCSYAECKEQFNIANISATAVGGAEEPDALYWSDNYSSGFDDFILFETKQQLDLVTLDFEQWVVSPDDCTNAGLEDFTISGFISGFDSFVDISSMNQIGGSSSALFNDVTNAEGMMSVMWMMQDICSRYYPALYDFDTQYGCPGALTFDSTKGNLDPLLDGNRGYCE